MITLVELPLVMPPAVAGLGLLVAFGRLGLLGHTLSTLGVSLAFTQAEFLDGGEDDLAPLGLEVLAEVFDRLGVLHVADQGPREREVLV